MIAFCLFKRFRKSFNLQEGFILSILSKLEHLVKENILTKRSNPHFKTCASKFFFFKFVLVYLPKKEGCVKILKFIVSSNSLSHTFPSNNVETFLKNNCLPPLLGPCPKKISRCCCFSKQNIKMSPSFVIFDQNF